VTKLFFFTRESVVRDGGRGRVSDVLLSVPGETVRQSLSCIAMQPCRNHLARFYTRRAGKDAGNGCLASKWL
ncbi:hypothetical protein, partial [Citrobacter freundii]|uniref:hypothetical protein n=1 Tax=Citrobacter freundii TaxID=546 RepID=UPI0023B0E10D